MKLYYCEISIPCRSVLLLLQTLNLQPELVPIDLQAGENLTPEFVQMNIAHTVPVLEDDGFVLTESRTILFYLAATYGKDSGFFSDDPKKRAIMVQRLFFDIGTLTQKTLEAYFYPIKKGGTINEEALAELNEALRWLDSDQYLGDNGPYIAGDYLTISDFSITPIISALEAAGHDFSPYPRVTAWLEKMKAELPGYAETMKSSEAFAAMVKNV